MDGLREMWEALRAALARQALETPDFLAPWLTKAARLALIAAALFAALAAASAAWALVRAVRAKGENRRPALRRAAAWGGVLALALCVCAWAFWPAPMTKGMGAVTAVEVRTRVPGDTVEFAGEHTLEDLQQTLAAFSEAGFTGVTALDLQTHTNIRAVYKGRITLEFGAASSLADKMAFIKATLERSEQTDPTFAGTFDFTIENRAYRNAATEPVPTTVPAQTAAEGNGPDASSETTLQAVAATAAPA